MGPSTNFLGALNCHAEVQLLCWRDSRERPHEESHGKNTLNPRMENKGAPARPRVPGEPAGGPAMISLCLQEGPSVRPAQEPASGTQSTKRTRGIMKGRASLITQSVKNLPAVQETWVQFLGREDPLEEGMATHSSILAWRIPWTEESGGL